jgi:hypothetical protein
MSAETHPAAVGLYAYRPTTPRLCGVCDGVIHVEERAVFMSDHTHAHFGCVDEWDE